MKHSRDYKAEYDRRIRNALARGLTRSQARGHPGAFLSYASERQPTRARSKPDRQLEEAIKAVRAGESLSAAARQARVGRERLAAYAKRFAGGAWQGSTWTFDDKRIRQIPIIAAGEPNSLIIRVPGFEPAHLAGQHFEEASQALEDQAKFPAFIERWRDVSITDTTGRSYALSIDPNQLYRAVAADEIDWTRIYHLYMH